MLLGLLDAAVLHQGREEVGLQTHGAGVHALAAADAVGLGLTVGFLLAYHQHAAVTLHRGSVEVHHGLAHHGAAADDLAGGLRQLADAVADDLVVCGADAHNVVVLRGQLLAGDGEYVLDERFVLLHSLVDGEGGAQVAHHAAAVDRQLATADLAAGDGVDELLLGALRVLDLQGLYDDALELLGHLLHLGNSQGLVALDADVGVGHAQGLAQDAHTDAHLFGMLHHHTVVAGEVRLALGGVDDEVLGFLALGDAVFDVRGEGGAAETHDAHLLELGNDLFRLQRAFALDVGRAVDGLHPLVALDGDINGGLGQAKSVLAGVDLEHGAADGRVHVGAHEGLGLADELAHLHLVALLHHRSGGGAEVLVHQHHHLLAHGHHLDGGVIGYLVLFGVNTTHSECLHLFKLIIEN